MDFDFLAKYEHLSTSDLLAIVNQPDEFQPAAVQAAQKLLNNRSITPEDESAMETQLQVLKEENEARIQKAKQYQEQFKSFFDPIIHPGSVAGPRKWINLLLFALALQYIWITYYFISKLVRLSHTYHHHYTFSDFYAAMYLTYTPIIALLLHKKKQLGWILLMVEKTYYLLFSIASFLFIFNYPFITSNMLIRHIWSISMNGTFVFFLWWNTIVKYFQLTPSTRNISVIVGCSIFLIQNSVLWWLYRNL